MVRRRGEAVPVPGRRGTAPRERLSRVTARADRSETAAGVGTGAAEAAPVLMRYAKFMPTAPPSA
jgi:hypothetical protein